MDDPDFRKSVVSINDNFDDSDDVGMEEYTREMINSVIMISILIMLAKRNTPVIVIISMITVKWL